MGGRILAMNTGNRNHVWAAYRWIEAELTASGYIQEAPTYIPEEDIWEEGLGELQGTAVQAWGEVNASLAGEEGLTAGGQGGEGREAEEGEHGQRQKVEVPLDLRHTLAHTTEPGRHAVRTRGKLTWCDVCGAYATERAGSRIMGPCQPAYSRHTATRLARLRQGRHPITSAFV